MMGASDLRYAARVLRRSPGFTTVAVLSLALGIGANTAIFSLIDSLMLRTLPVRNPGELVEFLQHYPGEPRGNGWFTAADFEHYRDNNHVFAGMTAAGAPARFVVQREGHDAQPVTGQAVAGGFFAFLGVRPALGRLIGFADIGSDAAVVSWNYWNREFNLDPAILGKHLIVQNQPVTIVGVTPRAFFGLQTGSRTDIWLPLTPTDRPGLALIARLKPGVGIDRARAEMSVLYRFTVNARAQRSQDSLIRQLKIEVEPAGAGLSFLRDRFATPLLVLMAIVGLLLLIACTNIASLLLARGAARRKEMAVRVSLGAGRLRLVAQVLTESMLLAVAGSLLGVVLAYFGAGTLIRIMTSGRVIGLPQPLEIGWQPDLRVLSFTAAIALLTGALFGLVPAWNAFTSAPASSLRDMGASGETRVGRWFGKCLVAAQVALSMALVTAAGLFIGNLENLEHLDLGFRRDHILLVSLDSAGNPSSGAYQKLLARLGTVPGVRDVSLSAPTPISGAGAASFANVEGFAERPEDRRYIGVAYIAPRYFETLGTPFLAGRDFTFHDEARPRVAIINQAMARYYFAGRDPLGKHIELEHVTGVRDPRTYEIVGVAGDANYYEIREAAHRTIYLPAFQNGQVWAHSFVLRTETDPMAVARNVRGVVRAVLGNVPVTRMTTLADQIDASIVPERLIAALAGSFGALGALLAAIGLYGLLAYTVTRRVPEFGIRMALGATGARLVRMVLRDAMAMTGAGLAIGAPAAFWGKRFAAHMIPDLPAAGMLPVIFGAAAMVAIALAAALEPARRAAGVDPVEALHHE